MNPIYKQRKVELSKSNNKKILDTSDFNSLVNKIVSYGLSNLNRTFAC